MNQRADTESLTLRIYVIDGAPNSLIALANLRRSIGVDAAARIEVIDVVADAARAERDGVIVTPTLVRTSPLPERRVVGNLQDRVLLRSVLGLDGLDGGAP